MRVSLGFAHLHVPSNENMMQHCVDTQYIIALTDKTVHNALGKCNSPSTQM